MSSTRFLAMGALCIGTACGSPPTPAAKVEAPPPDYDFDGLHGADDECPRQPEDGLGSRSSDGCPEPDLDRDGLSGAADQCPEAAETANNFRDSDGCPDDPWVSDAKGRRLLFSPPMEFEPDSAVLTDATKAQLRRLAPYLKSERQGLPIVVAVYEKAGRGSWLAYSLSQKRAASVQAELSAHGISAADVRPLGFGDFCAATHGAEAADLPRVDMRPVQTEASAATAGCSAARETGLFPPKAAPLADRPAPALP